MTKISRERVLEASYSLLDRVGLDDFSMRKVADVLNIKAATLYWYFTSKEDLFLAMAERLMENLVGNQNVERQGEDRIRFLILEVRLAMLSRRDGARLFTQAYPFGETVLNVLEQLSRGFVEIGVPEDKTFLPTGSLFTYVIGLALNEQSFPADRFKSISATEKKAIALRFPLVAASFEEEQKTDFVSRLEYGIEMHIAAAKACAKS